MPVANGPDRSLIRQVRNALAHLYDYAYLQTHPLAAWVDADNSLDDVTRAQRLRRLLLDGIEALRPLGQDQRRSDEARAHAILTYRYVDGIGMKEVASRRDLSLRQAYRELETGVEAVAKLVQDRLALPSGLSQHAQRDTPMSLVEAEIARMERTVHAEPLDLLPILDGVLALVSPLSGQSRIAVRVDRPEILPKILADRVLLRQALLNVLTHARGLVTPGHLALRIEPGQGTVVMALSGPVCSAGATRPSLPNDTPQEMTIARALLQAQGASIRTSTVDGCWHTELRLPSLTKTTVLVVDDNEDLVSLIRRYLAGHDLQVVGLTSSLETIDTASALQPQIITLDVMMPGLDGWEVLQQLKNHRATKDIPVIVCSVLREGDLARTAGASAYLTKPVSQDDFVNAVQTLLGPLQPLVKPA